MITHRFLRKYILTRIATDIVRGLPRILSVAMILCLFCFMGMNEAQEAKTEKVILEVKELVGEVLSFTPRGKPEFIGIAVNEENTDYIFILDKDLKLVHKRSLNQIAIGDMVRVRYYVIMETSENGRQRNKRVAKIITFVRAKDTSEGLRSK